jgi:hypothetical protein
MTDIGAKCKTLLYSRIWTLRNKNGSLTEALMSHWNLTGPLPNPPLAPQIPTKIAHFRRYNIDMAYVTEPGATETTKLFKHRIYKSLREMAANSEEVT